MNYDIATMAVDERGVRDFHWPIGAGELSAFRDRLAEQLIPLLLDAPERVPLLLGSHFMLRHLMALWQALALRDRWAEAGVRPGIPAGSPLWAAVMNGGTPLMPAVLNTLATADQGRSARFYNAGVGRAAELLSLLRWHRNPLSARFVMRPYTRSLARRHIVAVAPNGVMARHADAVDEPVFFVRLDHWFRPARNGPRAPEFVTAPVVEVVEATFRDSGVPLESAMRDHVRTSLEGFDGLIGAHLDRLRAAPDVLPRGLWTGTGGNIWVRILRQAVLETGGTATGHDHATGAGFRHAPATVLTELIACDRFVTTNQARAEALRLSADRSPLSTLRLPAIEYLSERAGTNTTLPLPLQRKTPRRIMYVSTVYPGDTIHLEPHIPDMVMVDWQARLLATLRQWGWDVVHKPHPESRIEPPQAFAAQFGVPAMAAPFEQVTEEADVFIFDKVNSTTFGHALSLNLPMVYVALDGWNWIPGALEVLKRRVPVIDARRTREGRIDVDWDDLKAALAEAPSLADDREFYSRYVS